MTNPETPQVETDSERWLKLIGQGDKIGTNLPDNFRLNGEPVKVEDFLLVCPEPVDRPGPRAYFRQLESTPRDHPQYDKVVKILKAKFLDMLSEQPVAE